MTTGSWDRGDIQGGNINNISFIGVMDQKSWTGTDKPKVERQPNPRQHTISRVIRVHVTRKGKVIAKEKIYRYSFKVRRVGVTPAPVRGSALEHDYTMMWNVSSSEVTGIGGNTAACQQGTGFNGGFICTSMWDANDQIKLVNKLRERLQGSSFNAAVFLGEGNQTLSLLADSASRIYQSLRALRRGNLAGSARILLEGTSRSPLKPYKSMKSFTAGNGQAIANNWIELQYGWRPLVDDAWELGNLLAHQLSEPLEMRVSASSRKQSSYNGLKNPVYVDTIAGPIYRWRYSNATKEEIHRLTCFIKERPNTVATLGLLQPELVLWELLPWSFVADWFIPIGQYMEARGLGSIYPGTYVSGTLTKGRNQGPFGAMNTNGGSPPTWPVWKWPWMPGEPYRAHATRISHVRTVGTSPAVPLPVFKPLAKAASWQHCANAVALLTQQFAGKGTHVADVKARESGRAGYYNWGLDHRS